MRKLFQCAFMFVFLLGTMAYAQLKPADLENIGVEHNKMMENIYNNLKQNNIQTKLGAEIKRTSVLYLNNLKGYSEKDIQLGIEIISNYVENPTFYEGKLYTDKEALEISEKTRGFLDALNEIINTSSEDNFEIMISNLENDIQKAKLSDKDLTILFSATNISKYSFRYWKDNYSKWETLPFVTSNKMSKKVGPGGRIVGADVAGGVGAAVTTWIVNAAPGAGQVAYGGAIVGGAVGASAGQAVMELGSYFGVW